MCSYLIDTSSIWRGVSPGRLLTRLDASTSYYVFFSWKALPVELFQSRGYTVYFLGKAIEHRPLVTLRCRPKEVRQGGNLKAAERFEA